MSDPCQRRSGEFEAQTIPGAKRCYQKGLERIRRRPARLCLNSKSRQCEVDTTEHRGKRLSAHGGLPDAVASIKVSMRRAPPGPDRLGHQLHQAGGLNGVGL